MGQDYNVQMKQFNGSDFDNIFPKVKVEGITDIGDNYYTKDETLVNDTKERYGLDSTAVPDDVFNVISNKLSLIMQNKAVVNVTVQDTSGNPLENVIVGGVFDENGEQAKTNTQGKINGYASSGSVTLSIKNYADIENKTDTFEAVKGETYNKTLTVNTRNFLKITSTKNLMFSGNVQRVDVTAVGGGGGGETSSYSSNYQMPQACGGGGGGYCTVQEEVSFQVNQSYKATVGAGGRGHEHVSGSSQEFPAADGGQSSFLSVIAEGGKKAYTTGGYGALGIGGDGNGKGGYFTDVNPDEPVHPVAGKTAGYSSFTETVVYGGGGCGAGSAGYTTYTSSAGYGGSEEEKDATDGFGGGGGGNPYASGGSRAGNGGSGCIAIRMHLKKTT